MKTAITGVYVIRYCASQGWAVLSRNTSEQIRASAKKAGRAGGLKGGPAMVAKYGPDYIRAMAQKGGAVRWSTA